MGVSVVAPSTRMGVSVVRNCYQKVKEWVGVDGLLHFLCCYCITITFGLINWWIGVITSAAAGVSKEMYDYFIKKSSASNIHHDLICDGVGILLSEMILMLRIFIYII